METLRVRFFACRSWQALQMNMEGGLPPEARSGSGERRVLDQTFSRSNQLLTWMRQLDALRLIVALPGLRDSGDQWRP